jgi:hypothetical protein
VGQEVVGKLTCVRDFSNQDCSGWLLMRVALEKKCRLLMQVLFSSLATPVSRI